MALQADLAEQLHVLAGVVLPGLHVGATARPAVDDRFAVLNFRPRGRADTPRSTNIGGAETARHRPLEPVANDHAAALRRYRTLVARLALTNAVNGSDLVKIGRPGRNAGVVVVADGADRRK